ncbi:MAG TPA: putative toxin-antitoxin system toxin component, PIN family [Chloroflexia bacterium]|nr:putative toxin-antitoxin system toxin component, PIN family [Chloroflexia bacterium]
MDANVLISYLLVARQSAISTIVEAAFQHRYTLLIPEELLTEGIQTVKNKPHLTKRITYQEVDRLANSLSAAAEFLPPILEDIVAISRDPADDYLLAYALVGRADYLVTGDDDLLSLGKVAGLQIIRPSDFLKILQEA